MKVLNAIHIFCIAAGLSATVPAQAAPVGAMPAYDGGLVQLVRGCHSDVRRHFVPEFGRNAWHFHRRNCRPVRANPGGGSGGRDCHRDVRRHYLPQYGDRVTHRHVGPNCRVRVYRQFNPNRPRPGSCVQLGPIRYCEY